MEEITSKPEERREERENAAVERKGRGVQSSSSSLRRWMLRLRLPLMDEMLESVLLMSVCSSDSEEDVTCSSAAMIPSPLRSYDRSWRGEIRRRAGFEPRPRGCCTAK